MGTPVSENYSLEGMNPLDLKIVSPNKAALTSAISNDEFSYFRFYKGCKIFFQQENEEWIWLEMISSLNLVEKLLPENYVYPTGTIAYGFDYSGKSFNFIKYSDFLKIIIEINSGLISDLENEGIGVDFFNGINSLTQKAKIARLNSGTQKILKQVDGSVNSEIEFFNRGREDAASIYEFFAGPKTHAISKLFSEDIIITKLPDGTIQFSNPGGGSTSNDWYLDANFQRPSNWGQLLNPKEEITYLSSMAMIDPAIYTNGQVVKVPSGTLNDPFKTYEEYLLKRIYGAGGSGTGTPSKHNPKYPVKTLQLLSSFSTSSDLEVINTTLYLKNFITLTYTGTRLYGLDYRTIYDALTVSGNLQIAIDNIIKGEGIITSINNFGLIYSKSDSTKTSNGTFCLLKIQPEGKGLYFIEGNNNVAYAPLTKNGGGPLKYGNNTVLGANQPPVTPLIVIEGTNFNFWNTLLTGTSIFIQTNTQIGIRYFNDGKITFSLEKLLYQVGNDRIGYETRIDASSTGENADIVDFYENSINGKVYYKPYNNYCMFRGEDTSKFRVENMGTFPNGFDNAGMNSIISLSENATFEVISEIKDVRGAPALSFIKAIGSSTIQNFNNADIDSKYFNFVKGDGTNTVSIYFKNSQIDARNISTDVTTLNIYTLGTLSSIKRNPIISLSEYANEADAILIGKLITGMIFKKTGTHEVINLTNL